MDIPINATAISTPNYDSTSSAIEDKKKISIICLGTRGDFQPYLALALELKAAGFNVRLLSVVTFEKFLMILVLTLSTSKMIVLTDTFAKMMHAKQFWVYLVMTRQGKICLKQKKEMYLFK